VVEPRVVSEGAERRVFPRWLVAVVAVVAVGFLLYTLRGVLTPVFFAFLIAYMLDPVVDRFEAMRIPRAAGITILLTVVLGALGLFVLLAVPSIVRDVSDFVRELPGKVDGLLERAEPWLAEQGIEIPRSVDEVLTQYDLDTQHIAGEAAAPAAAVLGWIVGGTASMLGAIAGAIMVPVFAFYLLYDFDRMIAAIRDLIPWRARPFVVDVAHEVDEVLGQFIRGQLIVMIVLAVLYAVGYSIVGIRLAIVIGIVAGLLSFIPYVGGAVALGLALLMCFLDFQGWGQVIGVVVVYGVVQLLEGFVITPKIVGDKVGLSAVWVLFALMVAGDVFGFMGVLLAVPAAAVAKIFVLRGIAYYRKTRVFLAGAPAAAQVAAPSDEGMVAGILHEQGLPDDPDIAEAKARAEHVEPEEGDEEHAPESIAEAISVAAEADPDPDPRVSSPDADADADADAGASDEDDEDDEEEEKPT